MESLVSTSSCHKPTIQPEVILPYEIKLMVFKNCDVDSIKALRLVSKSWASVGLDVLLLPNFVISPRKCDINRLLSISQHPILSEIAAKTIKSLEFLSNDWDLSWFRNTFSNRVESTTLIIPNSFVPTEDERKALDELDAYEAMMEAVRMDSKVDRLAMAFKAVPNYHTITITPRCVFQHRLLKKTWDEYAPDSCIIADQKPQIEQILKGAATANLLPLHLNIEELSSRFSLGGITPWEFLTPTLKELETFYIRIEDSSDIMGTENQKIYIYNMLRTILSSMPKVKSISVFVNSCNESWTASILPDTKTWSNLESLSISNAQINGPDFLSYLSTFRPTLKRLQLMGMRITSGEMRWKELLERLRGALDLERFQLAHSVWYEGDDDQHQEVWHMRPHCDKDWKLYAKGEETKSWELEKFMLEGGPWPMTDEDNGRP